MKGLEGAFAARAKVFELVSETVMVQKVLSFSVLPTALLTEKSVSVFRCKGNVAFIYDFLNIVQET